MSKKNNNFLVDNLTIAHTGSEGRVNAWQPFKQKKSIVQQLNTSKVEDAQKTTQSVLFNNYPALTIQSVISISRGDEATDGGLLNGSLKSQRTRLMQGSSGLLAEGYEIAREGDKCEPNRGNGPLEPLIQPGGYVPKTLLQLSEQQYAKEGKGKFSLIKVIGIGGNIQGYIDTIALSTKNNPWLRRKSLHSVEKSLITLRHLPEASYYQHWLILQDLQAGYGKDHLEKLPLLEKVWARYYPIPLFKDPGKPESQFEAELKTNQSNSLELTIFFPVAKNTENKIQLLGEGWLYLFLEGTLWREIQVKRYTRYQEAIYSFTDVNLITEAGRDNREATTQSQSDVIVIPTKISNKTPDLQIIFSDIQLNWNHIKPCSNKQNIEITPLTELNTIWIEQENPTKLKVWQTLAPARPALKIPASCSNRFRLCFKYTDEHPYAYQAFSVEIGIKKIQGRLDKNGLSHHLNLTSNDFNETLKIDQCEMINLNPLNPYPTHQQAIKLKDCKHAHNQLLIQVIPPPVVINLSFDSQQSKHLLSYSELNYFKRNGKNALIFIHGYNSKFGHYGHYPKSFGAKTPPMINLLDDPLSLNPNSDYIKLKSSEYIRTICCNVSQDHEIISIFPDLKAKYNQYLAAYKNNPDGEGQLDHDLNGTEAHHWFTHMEYNFNKAAGFDGKDYSKFTRILGVYWPGDVGVLEFNRADEIAHYSGKQLSYLIQQLANEGIEVNIVAHSLGNRVLLHAMECLGAKNQQETIAHTILWQAAIPDTALTNNPKVHTDRRLLTHYTHAHLSTQKITVLYSEKDAILKNPYNLSKKVSATPHEILSGKSSLIQKPYQTEWQKDFREELLIKSKDLPEYSSRSPKEQETFIGYLMHGYEAYSGSSSIYDARLKEGYCKLEQLDYTKNKVFINNRIQAIKKIIFDAKQSASNRFVTGPAMGYSGPKMDDFLRELEKRGKLRVVNQLEYLTGHSHMKVPSDLLMQKIYKDVIFGTKGINSFGKHYKRKSY